MAIIKMNKFTLLAFESQKEKLLKELQLFEGVQFINLQDEELVKDHEELQDLHKDSLGSKHAEYEENLSKLRFSLDLINNYAPSKSGLSALLSNKKILSYEVLDKLASQVQWEEQWKELKKLDTTLGELANEKNKLEGEIDNLRTWRNFDAPFQYLKQLNHTSYFIGSLSKQYEDRFINEFNEKISEGYLEVVNRDNQDTYLFILVTKDYKEPLEDMLKEFGFNSFALAYDGIPSNIIQEFRERIDNIHEEEIKIGKTIEGFKDKVEGLQLAYEYYNNILTRMEASNNFLKTNHVVTIVGWVPSENNEALEEHIKKALDEDYHLTFEEASEEEVEDIPIKLRNNAFASSFENIVEMYSLPLYKEVDPTPILSVFYFIFFGMMLSDAGYGLIMVIASVIAIKMIKDPEKKKNFKLFFYAGISTVIWGAIYGGWFGDLFSNYLGIKIPYLIDPPKSITQILIISVVFGLIHIYIGLGMKAYILIRDGQWKDAIYDVGTWYATLTGAILMFLGIGVVGKVLLIIGLVGLFLTQGRSYPTLGAKIGWGIYAVYGVTSYLGDVVSYSRLLALGLATGFIANALNLIVNLIPKPYGYIVAPLLFIPLHAFNLLVNALGSYVHAARLQYLEFFNKFYEGGGKKFMPYKLSDEYIKITK